MRIALLEGYLMQRANTRVLNLEGSECREQGKNSAWEQLRLHPIPNAIHYLYEMPKGIVISRNPKLVPGFSVHGRAGPAFPKKEQDHRAAQGVLLKPCQKTDVVVTLPGQLL